MLPGGSPRTGQAPYREVRRGSFGVFDSFC